MGGAGPHSRWAGKERRAGSPGRSWTLFSGEGRRGQDEEPERGRNGGAGVGWGDGGVGAEEGVETGEGGKRRRKKKERGEVEKGMQTTCGEKVGEKMNRRQRQTSTHARSGMKGALDYFPCFV